MAVSFKAVEDTMIDMKFSTFFVKSRTGNNTIGYQLDKKMDVDSAIDKLKKLLLEVEGDVVKVEINPRGEKTGDAFKSIKMDVNLSTVPGRVIAGHSVNENVNSGAQLKALERANAEILDLKEKLIKLEYEQKFEALQKQIEGIKENDPIGKLTEILIPVLVQYLPGMLTPKDAKSINGIDTVATDTGLPPKERARLMASNLIDIDPEADQLFAAIYLIASKNIDVYNTQKPMLINFAKSLE